jgi:hypothetical protein
MPYGMISRGSDVTSHELPRTAERTEIKPKIVWTEPRPPTTLIELNHEWDRTGPHKDPPLEHPQCGRSKKLQINLWRHSLNKKIEAHVTFHRNNLQFFARPANWADLPNPQKSANECSTSSVPLFVSPMRDNGAPGEAHDDLISLSQATINPSHSLEMFGTRKIWQREGFNWDIALKLMAPTCASSKNPHFLGWLLIFSNTLNYQQSSRTITLISEGFEPIWIKNEVSKLPFGCHVCHQSPHVMHAECRSDIFYSINFCMNNFMYLYDIISTQIKVLNVKCPSFQNFGTPACHHKEHSFCSILFICKLLLHARWGCS